MYRCIYILISSDFRERLANQKKNVLDTPIHLRNVPVQTFQDKEEIWNKELSQFTPADRETGTFHVHVLLTLFKIQIFTRCVYQIFCPHL